MAHYAQIDENNIVVQVVVASDEFIAEGGLGDPSKWIKTSYNTRNNVHELGGTPLRKNFASVGYIYHPDGDFFSPPQPYPSFVLNRETGQWEPPVSAPDTRGTDKQFIWDEKTKSFVELPPKNPVV